MAYRKCRYQQRICFVRSIEGEVVTIMTRDGYWAESQPDWERVDKIEWEKRVSPTDIEFVETDEES